MLKVIDEYGHCNAMLGLSLSKNGDLQRMPHIAKELACMDNGHNQFLQHICVWIDVRASRGWWIEAAKYHWLETQSESTTHSKWPKIFTRPMFFNGHLIPNHVFEILNDLQRGDLPDRHERIMAVLPDSYLQRRICTTNYQQIRTIVAQRAKHKREEWQTFCREILAQLEHPEYLRRKQ
jgi:hypothetical protein